MKSKTASKKQYGLYRPEEWRKKYSDHTETHLKSVGWRGNDEDFSAEVVLTTDDDKVPEEN